MFTKKNFNKDNFDEDLVSAVGNRLSNGEYTDAIIAGTKYLTDILREKGGAEGDGASLVGQVLGGNAPKLPINKLQTVSEKDEQKGIEQLLRGFYTGIRNPRTHEITLDTEGFAIRILIMIDTILIYLKREVEDFDVFSFVDRIYDPHFVASPDYAEALISQVPSDKLIDVFQTAFARRSEGKANDIKYAFMAMYQVLPEESLTPVIECIGKVLRTETDTAEIANLFRLLKPNAWQLLQSDVKMRMENMIIEECKKGSYDIYSGMVKGALGSWGNTFGRYFSRKTDLGNALISRLMSDWYTQNYVAKYFIYALPAIISEDSQLEKLAENLAYAALSNKAKLVRTELLEACENYPTKLKDILKVAIQERKDNDAEYAEKILNILS